MVVVDHTQSCDEGIIVGNYPVSTNGHFFDGPELGH
jgi:hypothetical protein